MQLSVPPDLEADQQAPFERRAALSEYSWRRIRSNTLSAVSTVAPITSEISRSLAIVREQQQERGNQSPQHDRER